MPRKLRIPYPGAVGWVGGGAARPAQGAPGQSRSRAPAAAGDDHEPELDRPAAGDGDLDLWVEPAQGAAASPGQELLPLGQEWGHLFGFGCPAYTSLGYEAKLGMNSQFARQYQLSRKEFLTNNSWARRRLCRR